MSEESKGMNLVAFGEKNVEAKFQMVLTQTDVIEAAVSEREGELQSKLDDIRKEISDNDKEIKKLKGEMDDLAKKTLESKFKDKAQAVVAAIAFSAKVSYTIVGVCQEYGDKKSISGSIKFMRELGNREVFELDVTMPMPTQMLAKHKVRESLQERNKELGKEEYDLADQLKHVDRIMRQAKAAITRQMLEKAGMLNLIPALTGKVGK